MGDIDNGDALALEILDQIEEHIRFVFAALVGKVGMQLAENIMERRLRVHAV